MGRTRDRCSRAPRAPHLTRSPPDDHVRGIINTEGRGDCLASASGNLAPRLITWPQRISSRRAPNNQGSPRSCSPFERTRPNARRAVAAGRDLHARAGLANRQPRVLSGGRQPASRTYRSRAPGFSRQQGTRASSLVFAKDFMHAPRAPQRMKMVEASAVRVEADDHNGRVEAVAKEGPGAWVVPRTVLRAR